MTVKRTAKYEYGYCAFRFPDRTLEELLLQFSLCDLNLNGLVNLLSMASAVVGVVLDRGGEKSVDESGLSEAGFTSNLLYHISALSVLYHDKTYHDGESSTALCDNLVAT